MYRNRYESVIFDVKRITFSYPSNFKDANEIVESMQNHFNDNVDDLLNRAIDTLNLYVLASALYRMFDLYPFVSSPCLEEYCIKHRRSIVKTRVKIIEQAIKDRVFQDIFSHLSPSIKSWKYLVEKREYGILGFLLLYVLENFNRKDIYNKISYEFIEKNKEVFYIMTHAITKDLYETSVENNNNKCIQCGLRM